MYKLQTHTHTHTQTHKHIGDRNTRNQATMYEIHISTVSIKQQIGVSRDTYTPLYYLKSLQTFYIKI
jgi:hypothetical protein